MSFLDAWAGQHRNETAEYTSGHKISRTFTELYRKPRLGVHAFILFLCLGNLKREHPVRVVVVLSISSHGFGFVFCPPDNAASVIVVDKRHRLMADLGEVPTSTRVSTS
jgi:hypothetical protein